MNRVLLIVGVLAAGLLAVTLAPLARPKVARAGAAAPEFKLAKLAGGLASLDDYRGRVVLLNFWATWCPSCVEELPALERLHRAHGGGGLSVVAVSVDEKGRAAVTPFVERLGLTFPVLLADSRVSAAYQVGGLPTTYLLDPAGVIVKRYAGPVDLKRLENDILDQLQRRKS